MGRLKYGDEAMNAIDNHIRPIGYKEFLLVPSIQQPVDAVPVIMCEYCNGKCSECPKNHIVITNHT